jgi:hypothetical protein
VLTWMLYVMFITALLSAAALAAERAARLRRGRRDDCRLVRSKSMGSQRSRIPIVRCSRERRETCIDSQRSMGVSSRPYGFARRGLRLNWRSV